MRNSIRSTLTALGTTAALASGGLGIAAAAGDHGDAAKRASAGKSDTPARAGGPCEKGGPGRADQKALAKALGVSTSELATAMRSIGPPPEPSSKPGKPGDMAAKLAEKLDLPKAKVEKALRANRPPGPPPGGRQGAPPAGGPPAQASPTG